jgi:regulator of RNase E activity RraA
MTDSDRSLARRAENLATSTLANALDDFGLADMILPTIKAVAPGHRCAGPAITVRQSVGEVGAFASEDFRVGAMIDAAGPGDVIMIEASGANISTWGGMASFAAKHKGIAGLVVAGGARDLEEIVGFEFPVFARHLTPTTGRTRLKVEAIGEPIVVDGVPVAPGDLVVADGTGIVVLPTDKAAEIIEAAIEDLAGGLSFSEAMAKYTRI